LNAVDVDLDTNFWKVKDNTYVYVKKEEKLKKNIIIKLYGNKNLNLEEEEEIKIIINIWKDIIRSKEKQQEARLHNENGQVIKQAKSQIAQA
jgi:hypothetical protein